MKATVTSKGQITIPAELRRQLDIQAGTTLNFELNDDQTISIQPVKNTFRDLMNILPKPDKSFTLEELKDGVRDCWAGIKK